MPHDSTSCNIESIHLYNLREPPPCRNDAVTPALFIPVHAVHEGLKHRKVRLIGQILHFNNRKAILIITSHPSAPTPTPSPTQSPTLIADISIPLLANSPSARDVTDVLGSAVFSRMSKSFLPPEREEDKRMMRMKGLVGREMVSMRRGEWVNLVGWLEDGKDAVRKIQTLGPYAPPPPLILEVIHISNSRPFPTPIPKLRGEMDGWNGQLTAISPDTPKAAIKVMAKQTAEGLGANQNESWDEVTPKPKRIKQTSR
ncbi:hypothetical protein C343_05010 [Cryptococcus neoformans C23]|uniref:Uncharacterized protein n=1 Tax=Cryptococcus neoformans (strain H99 / ATCC 208821 / CBS 10515 / FGSC 9487) TaxID=235443 RepID=J9VRM9_CRYN9|nr:hypothetical protein CNAG_04153 [Cryptococcus neoformans var. grubii H99]AUB26847.1 hypothetical protein CKF44_04153 [Cryptococcus neoformans var. grubii]OWZ29189.1 hypothetical protein C347_05056 [Cryptococcus neoformans var. grubii AD2-60a]OWZ36192.1 hypothetical protein C353_04907 [Cryptococcus neoformans var. grubii AD1-83a]OWZ41055.1 hypothetical protein C343_05010 [Cryptococcus neoformans var. grubii C23]OWZ52125.1 hypothetical protein C368_05166 [Cryptococcus neoformans var. grubii 1|eukprot:XP_012051621.1 hypothetical protein CNAG_04153 [Cryptococcus neoformans var. grubii H99]